MKLNGVEMDKQVLEDMFTKMASVQGTVEVKEKFEEEQDKKFSFELKNCNNQAEIPARYGQCLFSDYDYGELGIKIQRFAMNPEDQFLLLCGPTGVGKTSLMCASLHERALKDLPAGFYFNNRFLAPKLRTCRSFSARENEEAFLRRLSKVPFLCIDEVGTCPSFKEEAEFMTTLICARYDEKLPTFISTNLSGINFAFLICGIENPPREREEQQKLVDHLKATNATLNRFYNNSIRTSLTTESHR